MITRNKNLLQIDSGMTQQSCEVVRVSKPSDGIRIDNANQVNST